MLCLVGRLVGMGLFVNKSWSIGYLVVFLVGRLGGRLVRTSWLVGNCWFLVLVGELFFWLVDVYEKWLVGWCWPVGLFFRWLVGWSVGVLVVGRSVACLISWSFGRSVGCLGGCLVG